MSAHQSETTSESQALIKATADPASLVLMPVMNLSQAKARMKEFREFVADYLEEGIDGDYGVIPGTKNKKTLLKPGADKLQELYGMADSYTFDTKVEDWDGGKFAYTIRCTLHSRRDGSLVGEGMGSCSSYESKYRYRSGERVCPNCAKPTIIRGRDFNSTGLPQGWLCYEKKGGCGAKFAPDAPAILDQLIGRQDNPDVCDQQNTILKIAKKRAKVDAIISVTRSSGIFSQDMEDRVTPPAEDVIETHGKDVTGETSKSAPGHAPAAVAPSTNGNGDGRNVISDSQRSRAFAIGRAKGFSTDQYRDLIKKHGYESDRVIPKDPKTVYDGIVADLEKGPTRG